MSLIWSLVIAALILILVAFLICFYCFRVGFYSPPRKPLPEGEIEFPEGEIYEPYHDSMRRWAEEARAMNPKTFQIQSFDGLTLRGKYYEFQPGAPIELMFHGYRGSGERDLTGGVQRCFRCGRSALIVDQRASGTSDGNIITFGAKEHRDCLSWLDFMLQQFGPDVKIILTGISMGAATVLLAGGKSLPKNVLGILADCGYHSAKAIMMKTIKEMGLPPKLAYPFVKLSARLLAHFDLEEAEPVQAVKSCTVPVLFFHGDNDDFVPWEMSQANYDACASRKKLVLIPGAGHGLAYPKDPELYLSAAREFFGPEATALAQEV